MPWSSPAVGNASYLAARAADPGGAPPKVRFPLH
jgi:hypothetical protein